MRSQLLVQLCELCFRALVELVFDRQARSGAVCKARSSTAQGAHETVVKGLSNIRPWTARVLVRAKEHRRGGVRGGLYPPPTCPAGALTFNRNGPSQQQLCVITAHHGLRRPRPQRLRLHHGTSSGASEAPSQSITCSLQLLWASRSSTWVDRFSSRRTSLAALRGAANLAALRGVANIEQYTHLRLHHHLRPRVHAQLRRDPPGERLT